MATGEGAWRSDHPSISWKLFDRNEDRHRRSSGHQHSEHDSLRRLELLRKFWRFLFITMAHLAMLIYVQMQCLVAPTRAEIDKAHAKGAYLDVAVQSLRNLGSLSMYKVFLWSVLAISSLPLHLMSVSAQAD